MARWFEDVPGGGTRSTRTTRVASVAAGGALLLATFVAAPTVALAEDPQPEPVAAPSVAGPADPVRGTGSAAPSEPVVVGLVVEHEGSALALEPQTTGPAAGNGFAITATAPGESLVSFDEPVDAATAEQLADQVERQAGVREVSLNLMSYPQAPPPGGYPPDYYFELLHGVWDDRPRAQGVRANRAFNVKLPAGGFSTKAPALWRLTKGSSNIVVAVVDTGSTPHPDLDSNTVPGYDLISDGARARDGNGRDPNPNDEGDWVSANECVHYGWPPHGAQQSTWHGTHVAGTIAAPMNSIGVVGNAPGVKVQHVRVLGKCGGTALDIANGITWASGGKVAGLPKNPTPSKVLNLSLGGPGKCQPVTQKAINGARKRGAVVIVAAGNEGQNVSGFQPANCKNVITVASTDWIGARASYSNFGKKVDVSAPGGAMDDWQTADAGILSTHNDGTQGQGSAWYAYMHGTSMATPGVSGVAALIVSLRPGIKPKQLERVLRQSTRKFPKRAALGQYNCRKGKKCGKGLIDAARVPTTFLAKPKVKNVRVGRKAKAKVKAVAPSTKFKYQWLRNGKKIKGATKKTYKVKKKDRGKRISVRVTAQSAGFPNRKATSKKVKAKKNQPKVKISLRKKTIKRKARARLTVNVNVGHLTKRPTGTLRVSYGKKSKTYKLKKGRKGKVTLKLPKMTKGKHTIRVRYIPSKKLKKNVTAKNSKKLVLRVR